MSSYYDTLQTLIEKQQDIIIYGAGRMASCLYQWITGKLDYSGNVYFANTKARPGQRYQNYVVHNIDEMVSLSETALVLVYIYEGYIPAIKAKLEDLKFCKVQILGEEFVEECIYGPLKKYPIQNNKVIVENFHGLGYGDNPKYVVKELLERDKDLDIVWIVKEGCQYPMPEGVRTVPIYSPEFYYELYTSRVWLGNVRKYQSVRKRSGQYYIQTWHGFTLKTIEKDAEPSKCSPAGYFDAARKDSKMMDLLLSNSTFLTKIYAQTFWYEGEIRETGTPRNDVFFKGSEEICNKVRAYYGITHKKIVLYAPTYRKSYTDETYLNNMEKLRETLAKRFGRDFVVLLRMHPNVAEMCEGYEYSQNLINATFYDDMMELLVAADVLVTDYSSSMFDYFLSGKPVFLYAQDVDAYQNDDRGTYFEYESLPFPIAYTVEELWNKIIGFDEKAYEKDCQEFKERMGFLDDGLASERVADVIMKKVRE